MGKRKKYFIINDLRIIDLASEGVAVGRNDNYVVFVKDAVPGDVVDVKVIKKRKNYAEAKLLRITEPSTSRVEPFCEHFGICGGCKWQMLSYEKQLFHKEKQVKDQFERIGKISDFRINKIIPSPQDKYYRNKLEYTFTSRRWINEGEPFYNINDDSIKGIGFHVSGMFDRVVDIKKCYLQKKPSNEIRNKIREYCLKNSYDFYNPREHKGLMRNLIIRITEYGHLMVIVVFARKDDAKISALMKYISEEFPEITSLQYVINSKNNDSLIDQNFVVFKGTDFIIEYLGDLKFKIGPKSFFQTNTQQTKHLYDTVLKLASPKADDVIYDLYTGTGSIALYLAKSCKKVVGIEFIPEAIEDAIENSKFNKINNAFFYAGDIKDVFSDLFVSQHQKPNIIVLDPPRAGIDSMVINQILKILPEKIVYVSCNPATQARDIELLSSNYKVEEIQPVDMFPHTQHVENVALLTLKAIPCQ